jgi:hypothetical protein
MLRTGLFATAALLTAACAVPGEDAASARDCFRAESVSGFSVIDRNTVEINVGASRRYHLTTNWPTANLDFSERIALRSTTGSICTGSGLGVEIVGGEPITAYPIQSVARAPERAAQG